MPAPGTTRLTSAALFSAVLLCTAFGAIPAGAHPYGDLTRQAIEALSKQTTPVAVPSAQERLGVSKAAPYATLGASALNPEANPPREAFAPVWIEAPYAPLEGHAPPTQVVAACGVFTNCSFETGNFSGWITSDIAPPFYPINVESAGGGPGIFPFTPTDGTYAMVAGFDGGGPGDITVAQDVTLPFAAARITFDYRAGWNNTGVLDRTFSVEIQPVGGGAPLQSTTILTAPAGTNNLDTGPLAGGVPVGLFGGAKVRVVFRLHIPESFTGVGEFMLDNISVVESACVAFDNCSFETGAFPNWIATDLPGGPFVPLTIVPAGATPGFGLFATAPTDGGLAMVTGFDGAGPGDITVAQDVLLPATTNRLQFDFRAGWDMFNYGGSTLPRSFSVEVQPFGGGAPLQSDLVFKAPPGTVNLDSGPRTGTVDLGAFSGQAVRVVFLWHIPENYTGPGFFQLDNVRLTEYACMSVANCSFETGSFSSWIATDMAGPFYPLNVESLGGGPGIFPLTPTDGTYALVNGFDGAGPGDIRVAQDVAIPADVTYLEFDYRAGWDMLTLGTATLPRTFNVDIEPNGGGAPLTTTEVFSAAPLTKNLDAGPRSGAVTIGAFAGQTVRIVLRWHIPETFTGVGMFQLDKVELTTPDNVSVSDGVSGGGLELSAAIPNPSANGARFRFSLPRPTSVRFEVLDATGRRVWQQAPGGLVAGEHSLTWNGRDLSGHSAPAGIYFARLITPDGSLRTMFVRME